MSEATPDPRVRRRVVDAAIEYRDQKKTDWNLELCCGHVTISRVTRNHLEPPKSVRCGGCLRLYCNTCFDEQVFKGSGEGLYCEGCGAEAVGDTPYDNGEEDVTGD
jgi:hypothetical protein